MVSTQYFVSLSVLLAVVGAVPSSQNAAHVFQRSALLEGRQSCPAGYIPACPVGIPCVPPGSICCDDGVTYVFPPNSCPDGTLPVATASNQGQEPTTTLEPSSTSTTTATASEVPPTITKSSTVEPSSTAEPTTTSTYVLPTTNGTISSTGGGVPSPTFTQVPVGGAASLEVVGVFGIAALLPAVLMNWL